MRKLVPEIIGWYGTAAILGAYAAVSFSLITSSSFLFQFLNLTGSIGIIVISLTKKVYQSVVLNIIWGLIAVIALIHVFVH